MKDFSDLEALVNRSFTFGGIISEVKHLTSKAGKGWAIFIVEDYEESHEFRIFGEEYLKNRHFLLPNSFVYVKGFVKEGWLNRDTNKRSAPRIQFSSFKQLHDVMKEQAKKLTVQLNVDDIKEEQIKELKSLFQSHKGDKMLNFVIYELKEKMKLHMPSRRQKVAISQELLTSLDEMQVHYKVNS